MRKLQFYPGKNCVTYVNNFGLRAGCLVSFVPSKIFLNLKNGFCEI